mmetsp:Transcript_11880/g.11796  ORF Transcript_11880/g.11796 Transcript_11880/m.11796 type:complete len:300 (+) Transcript_11880:407-1306(+)
MRTCKHLTEHLGREYELNRLKGVKGSKKRDQKANAKKGKKMPISLMLAETYDPDKVDPTGWLMSEKMDGVRCFWDGKNMFSRAGNKFFPPSYFLKVLPKDFWLDGELWTDRNDFERCVSIVRRQDENEEWKEVKFMVFDTPKMKNEPFSVRLEKINEVVSGLKTPFIEVLEHTECKSRDHMVEEMDKVLASGGEGLMLRKPDSKYEQRRSSNLLKVKKFDDSEATVIGHEAGKGKLKGVLGAVKVRLDDGKEFKIGSGFNYEQREDPPKIGARVTFKYMGKSKAGIPRFPIFLREHPGL